MENEDEVHTEGEVGGESGEDEEEGRRGRQKGSRDQEQEDFLLNIVETKEALGHRPLLGCVF